MRKPNAKPIPYADPLRAGRHPFQTYLLGICCVTGLPLLLGHVTAGGIDEALPYPLAIIWGLFLFVGSIVTLTGAYWRGAYANALTLERVGLLAAGSAGIAYALVVAVTVPPMGGLTAGGIILGFGLSCIVRARDIGKIMHRAKEKASPVVAREGESDAEATIRDDEEGA